MSVALLLIAIFISCKKEPVSGVNLDKFDMYLGVGKTDQLTASIVPPNAFNHKVAWESSNPEVATVTDGTVHGNNVGSAIITVITEDNHRMAKCFVTVGKPIEPEMVWVEGGTFVMGCQEDTCLNRELPAHEVILSGFNIMKYPITQKEWVAIMVNNPSNNKGNDFPVEMISYENIQTFIQRINSLTDKQYRLPTEAEWEFAARGGNKSNGYRYSGSDNVHAVAWIDGSTHIVGTKAPNELNIYDMSGNVFEFCSDWFGSYSEKSQTNPQGPETGIYRVIRGGNYGNVPYYCRVAYRLEAYMNTSNNTGFRLVHQ